MPAQHQTLDDTTTSLGLHLLQLATGIIGILVFTFLAQVAYVFGADGIDLTYQQQKIAGGMQETRQVNVVNDPIAAPQEGDPPVDQAPAESEPIGWMYIPRLGSQWRHLIQEGTTQVILDNVGIGHYEHTVMAGAVGNAGYAGHRMPSDLGYADRLKAEDTIVIQSGGTWYVYTVTSSWITTPEDTGVLTQDTGEQRWITLTTCDPMINARTAPRRLIVRGQFKYWARVADGVPQEIAVPHDEVNTIQTRLADTVRQISHSTPVTPILAGMFAVAWLVLNAIAWLASRGEHKHWDSTWNPLTWVWRMQAGPIVLRLISLALFTGSALFACFAWVCPWIAANVPGMGGFSPATL